jgi:putative addiction module component (TIGR02574 family)
MNATTQAVLNEALALKPMERTELIDALLESFRPAQDARIMNAWEQEVESRIDAYDADELGDDSAEAMFERINRR